MTHRKWSYEDDLTLKAWADYENVSQLAKRLNRTESSIKNRLNQKGILKKSVYSPHRSWTEKEVQYLQRNAGKMKTEKIAQKLKKNVSAVKNKASSMDLSLRLKDDTWTAQEKKLLKESLDKNLSWLEISKTINRTPGACRKKAGELDLNLGVRFEWNTRELNQLHSMREEGKTYKTIAERLGRSEQAVRKRYMRFLKERSPDLK